MMTSSEYGADRLGSILSFRASTPGRALNLIASGYRKPAVSLSRPALTHRLAWNFEGAYHSGTLFPVSITGRMPNRVSGLK
jgi:hypothetical protein